MALFLTLFSIALCYFSPEAVVPFLAPYHIQQFLLGGAVVISLVTFNINRGGLRSTQTILMGAFWFAIVISVLTRGWLRDSLTAFLQFGLVVGVFLLVVINAYSVRRISLFCRVISLCALVMALEAIVARYTGIQADKLVWSRIVDGELVQRVNGYGILNDANDFAQFLLIGLAFLGVSWRKGDPIRNFILVLLPGSILIYTIYLTGSRGAIFGLAAIAFVVISRRMSMVQSAVLAGLVVVTLVLGKFGRGADISLHESSAAGRVMAWGSGISQLRSDPLFGVGFGQFIEYSDMTAHNSFVLCFAETGFFGYFFWLALLVTSALGLEGLNKLPVNTPEDADFARCVTAVRAALYTFLATAWFLSRTYHETLYIILALATVLICLRREEFPATDLPLVRWAPLTFVVQVASVLAIYAIIRLRAF
ncbi:MAG: O-antigen ligase family protein [Bryobacteraceae bacterium]